MKKIKRTEAIKSTTMFLIDEKIEQYFDKLIQNKVAAYQEAMLGIGTKDGLKKFILENTDSITMLETVLGISGERMKRVVTMLRVNKGYTFDSEWDEKKLQVELTKDERLLNEYCELYLKGNSLEKYKELIPKFILDDFCIDADILARVMNKDILKKLFKKKNDTSYTSRYKTFYENKVKESLGAIFSKLDLTLEAGEIEHVGKDLHYTYCGGKYIIFTYNYSLTTGQGQTNYYRKVSSIYKKLQPFDNMILINILDGAGWVGRSADFKKIYNDCNYFANLNKLDHVKDIVKEFFNIQ